jgi:hypothetical protein
MDTVGLLCWALIDLAAVLFPINIYRPQSQQEAMVVDCILLLKSSNLYRH